MKKIILTAAAVLAITGSAFADSDVYGSNHGSRHDQAAASVDSSYTASTQKLAPADKQPLVQGSDRDLFGR